MAPTKLRPSRLTTKTSLKPIIKALESRNWYKQQPAVDFVVANGPEQVAEMAASDQVLLGRNILQVADGDERSAKRLLKSLADDPKGWPKAFLRGVLLECFVNDSKQVRMKCDHLKTVLDILAKLEQGVRDRVVEKVAAAISEGKPKGVFLGKKEYGEVCEALDAHDWAESLKQALESLADELVTAREDAEDG